MLTVLEQHSIVRQAKIRLSLKLCGECFVGLPKQNRGFYHMVEVECDPLADVAGLLKLRDTLDRLIPHSSAKSAVLQLPFELFKVALFARLL